MRCLGILLFCVLGTGLAHGLEDDSITDDIKLTADEANGFMAHPRVRRGLHHECYSEGCSFEEVREVLGRSQYAYEYYYTYTCNKFKRNCKVRCNYRKECTFGAWGSWTKPDIPKSDNSSTGCYKQFRYQPYQHPLQTTYQRWNCNGLKTSCPATPSESRLYCLCKKAVCNEGSWSSWVGIVPKGKCTKQTRQQPYRVTWTTEASIGSCQGVSDKCPAPNVDLRKRCSCSKAVCSLGNWGSWSGNAAQGQCGSQVRTRSYSKSIVYEERQSCDGVSKDCPTAKSQTRKFCSCKYAICKLGEWSEWSPQALAKGSCGQQQSRQRRYELTVAYQNHVGPCPSLPQKCPADIVEKREQCSCAYRDSCALGAWSEWSADVTEEGCKIQTRTRPYKSPLKHAQGDSCKGLNTECVDEPKESRTFCKCKYLRCDIGVWNEWSSDDISAGSCGEQRRTRSYTSKEVFENRVDNCNGLPTVCPSDQHQTRSMCKCKTVTCEVGDWGPWQGDIPSDTCSTQTRKKSLSANEELKYQKNTCEGLPTKCSEPQPESRKMCNCSHREDCTLKEWGSWSGDVPDVGCAVQIRNREYNKSIIYIEKESCEGLDVCPAIRDETRTKCNCNQIICGWTEWFRAGYDPETRCYEEVRVRNMSSGFKKIERMGSCDGIPTFCTDDNVEKRKDCQSGGGGHVIVTSPPVTTRATTLPPTTAFVPATYVSLGCFADSQSNKVRSMSLLYLNLRSQVDWYDLKKTVQGCANAARERRFKYFGVQFFGECWGGPSAGKTFARNGPSNKCWNGVGQQWANAVYRVEDMPACSEEMKFNAQVSSGDVSEGSWCAGNEEKYQWIVLNLESAKRITGIGTQGGNKDSWVTVYSLEHSEEGESWMPYKEEGVTKIFAGNSDRFTLETHWLKFPINAQYLRFKPKSWTSTHVCMKVRVYGCNE
ncbi:uncharacterized protein LOC116305210 [Actinia tenebrosa]|uniref:Uncharacterized protein LOC116305210 n=1 Tax=Actinia tenebrosa TaxID=6105 RepID=A0A6P8IY98_ACTTE|nr:uncharacterized protein LOC116305210 [Actinia tenebrosa]